MVRALSLLLLLTLAACGGGGSPTAAPPPPPRVLSQPEVELATRVAETQLANGSWSFQQPWYQPVDHAFYGYQNVTGITALGLFDAYDIGGSWFLPATLDDAKDYLVRWCRDFVDGTPNPWGQDWPGMIPTSVSLPTFLFLVRYRIAFGLDAAEEATLAAAWTKLLVDRDAVYGTDPTVQADGIFNRIATSRAGQGIPGIIGWDCAFLLKALLAMGAPAPEIQWTTAALLALPVDASQDYGLDSIAHVLEACHDAGDTSQDAALLAAMNAERNPDGSYTDNPEAAFQTTAYCLLALKALGSPLAGDTAAFLESRIRLGGYVYDPADDLETYEASGEVLLALLR